MAEYKLSFTGEQINALLVKINNGEVLTFAEKTALLNIDMTKYSTTIEMNQKIQEAVENAQITVDLKDYQKKTDNNLTTTNKTIVGAINENKTAIETKANNNHNHDESYASKDSEHSHDNKSILDAITQAKIDSWDAGTGGEVDSVNWSNITGIPANFPPSTHTHDYNDLTNKPVIPSISNLQTKTSNTLLTTDKSIEGAINELFQNVSSGKTLIASAITDKGIPTSDTDTWQIMADNIHSIESSTNTLTLSYSFDNEIRGYAKGTISLMSTNIENDGNYDIYWGNSSGKLSGYDAITSFTISGNNSIKTYSFLDINAIPKEATSIIAIKDNIIKATFTLPSNKLITDEKLYSVGVLSDIHIDGDGNDEAYSFEDLKKIMNIMTSESIANVIMGGDVTTDGYTYDVDVYKSVKNLYTNINMYVARGNHDLANACSDIAYYTTNVEPNGVYYERTINNEKYLFIGMVDETIGLDNCLTNPYSQESITWLKSKLEEYRNQRCYVIAHIFIEPVGNPNGLYPWDSLSQQADTTAKQFRDLMSKYRNVVFFSGHSHFDFNMQQLVSTANCMSRNDTMCHNIHVPSASRPRRYDTSIQNYYEGSQGYIMDVYNNYIVLRGMDFVNNKHIPYAQYIINTEPINIPAEEPPIELTSWVKGSINEETGEEKTSSGTSVRCAKIEIDTTSIYTLSFPQGLKYFNVYYYDENNTFISCYPSPLYNDLNIPEYTLNQPMNVKYLRVVVGSSTTQDDSLILAENVIITKSI